MHNLANPLKYTHDFNDSSVLEQVQYMHECFREQSYSLRELHSIEAALVQSREQLNSPDVLDDVMCQYGLCYLLQSNLPADDEDLSGYWIISKWAVWFTGETDYPFKEHDAACTGESRSTCGMLYTEEGREPRLALIEVLLAAVRLANGREVWTL